MAAVILAFASSLCWGLADFLGGLQSRTRPLVTVLLVAQVAAVAIGIAFVLGSGDAFPEPGPAALATAAGVAVTVSLALKNQICFRSFAVWGLSWVGHGDANGRSMRWPHIGQSHAAVVVAPAARARAGSRSTTLAAVMPSAATRHAAATRRALPP